MTTTEIATMMNSIGQKFTYYSYPVGQAPNPPYNIFYYPNRDDFIADGTNYQQITTLIIEHYSDEKDFSGEAAVEAKLTANGLVYSKEETYIESEKMFMVTYEMEVLLDG